MNKGLVLFAVGLMSWTMAGSAFAGPFGRFQRAARPPQQQQRAMSRGGQGADEGEESREKDRIERMERGERAERNGPNGQAAGQPAGQRGEGQRNGEFGQGGAQQVPVMPGGRAGARMSLEERQKLRRQINEAGRSLYTPPTQTGNK